MPMYKRLLNLPSDIIWSIKIQCFPLLVIKIKIYYFILRKMRYERFVTALIAPAKSDIGLLLVYPLRSENIWQLSKIYEN